MKDVDYAALAFASLGIAIGGAAAKFVTPEWWEIGIATALYFVLMFKAWQTIHRQQKETMTTLEKLKPIIADKLGCEETDVTETARFREDLGCDFLDNAEVAMAIEDAFDIVITDENAEKVKTCGDAAKLVDELTGA